MITIEQARTRIGARVLFVHSAQKGRNDGYGILRGVDPSDSSRALVRFDYDPDPNHVSHPVRELLIFVEDNQTGAKSNDQ